MMHSRRRSRRSSAPSILTPAGYSSLKKKESRQIVPPLKLDEIHKGRENGSRRRRSSLPDMMSRRHLPAKVLVSRSSFKVIHKVFKEYDSNKDNLISQGEFEALALSLWAPGDDQLDTVRGRSKLAQSEYGKMVFMVQGMWRSFDSNKSGFMSLPQLVKVYYPHLSISDCKHVVQQYTQPSREKLTLHQRLAKIPGALEEIRDLFNHWDHNGDGFVEWGDLASALHEAGIDRNTAEGWILSETGKPETRPAKGQNQLDYHDIEALLGSNYLPRGATFSSPRNPTSVGVSCRPEASRTSRKVLDGWLKGEPVAGLGFQVSGLA